MQIRTRLTLFFTLNTAFILAGVLFYVWWSYNQQLEEEFYQGLASKARLTARTTIDQTDLMLPLPVSSWFAPDTDTLPYQDNVSLYNSAYQRVFSMHEEAPPVAVKTLQDIQKSGEFRFRIFNLHALGVPVKRADGNDYMVIAEGYCNPGGAIQLRNILIGSFLLGMTAFATLGWFLAGQALAPVSRIIQEVNDLQPADLSRRLQTGPGKDEMTLLSATFNRMLDRIEYAFRMQRMFLSNVSHELRNPLTAMRTQIDVALQRQRQPEEYQQALESLMEDLREISEVEEKLLLLAKMLNDPSAIPLSPVRLDELLWQTRELVQKRNEQFRVHLEYEDMPESEEALMVQANEALLRTALLNLCENGCKYAPDHQVVLRLSCRPEGRHIVEVEDHGPGIPPEEMALIFQPFYRSPRHRNIRGAGVGLSLVQSIVQIHKISLQVENNPEGGAVFRLTFPS